MPGILGSCAGQSWQPKKRGVSIGAHPAFPDLQGFGRRRMDIPAAELEAMIIYQIGALQAMASAEGVCVSHVKPHGALNNMACADPALADCVARAVYAISPQLILLAPAYSRLASAGERIGLPVILETFADRGYQDDGQLVPRSQPGAMIHGTDAPLAHVLRMLDEQAIVSVNGKRLPTRVQSIWFTATTRKRSPPLAIFDAASRRLATVSLASIDFKALGEYCS